MRTYQITVYVNRQAAEDNKKAFERLITLPDSCEFEYSLLSKALRILYGAKAVIQVIAYDM